MWVGVDIGNTVANVSLQLLRRFNIPADRYPPPMVNEDWFATPVGLEILWSSEPFPGAAQVLHHLVEVGHRLAYLSSRPPDAAFITRRWLAVHGFPDAPMILVPRGHKAQIVKRWCFAAFFEDDPREIRALHRAGVKVIVKDWPYNRSVECAARFRAWRDIAGQAAGILSMD